MKISKLFIFLIVILTSCTPNENSKEFIEKAKGKYLFNADETFLVCFKENALFLKWRGQNIHPLKVSKNTFYVQAMNEKLIFLDHKIELAPKKEHKGKKFVFTKLKEGEKTPSEYLKEGNYDLALKGFEAIQAKDSLNPVIKERTINKLGYQLLKDDQIDKAIQYFIINTKLYPNSSNTFDRLGDAYLQKKDTVKAIKNYKKALVINPEKRNSKKKLKRIYKK